MKRNLEGNILSWIAGTYPNFKQFYTSEVEKSLKNHLSLKGNAGKNEFVYLPYSKRRRAENMWAQIIFELQERCIRKVFQIFKKGLSLK